MNIGTGERIKLRRKELGLTQSELCERMGFVNKSTISKVESGIEDNMTLDRIERYAKALEVTPGYLMGWEDNLTEDSAVSMANILKSNDDTIFIETYSKLPQEDKKEVQRFVDFLISKKVSD